MASSTDSDTNRTIVFADPPTSTNYVYASVPISSLNQEIMDVAFVSSVGSDIYPGGIEQQVLDHRFDDAVILSDYWAHKYILDLDGMSYSGKFLAFLGSDSVVIKSSVYQEFFSDWIQPWCVSFLSSMRVFYVPLNDGYVIQASLHSTVDVIRRDIQHPCLLFRWYTRRPRSRKLHRAAFLTAGAHISRGRYTFTTHRTCGKALEKYDRPSGRYGR
jgi:hypothetical protein